MKRTILTVVVVLFASLLAVIVFNGWVILLEEAITTRDLTAFATLMVTGGLAGLLALFVSLLIYRIRK